ncbi:GNAT family N-acetyltransferase [Nocardioides mangrovi]|uniref:GNAT family N-acetyltransferase n=1 Tax=Nocardioides mangrovi TaxID=2874580 RepID=A0ABS7UB80_9ACTN|nr:GNAT family N-acetyltransferase [Nocardioides mangrovi]MBZ5738142.1 GNAT family N-acetyltransferase [Nocardioides mangrovi]
MTVEVRPYDPRDRAGLVAAFGAAGAGAPGGEAWGHEPSVADVYLTPYLDLEPASVFVVTVDDLPAGYLAGCVDDAAFPSEEERFEVAARRHRIRLRPRPALYLARAAYDARVCRGRGEPVAEELDDPRWPSHLHIDIAAEARGTGAGARLMELWFDRLRSVGSPGCYLQTSAENARAIGFFEHVGFRKHGPTPVVPGSRYQGRIMHQQTMVRETTR